MKASLSQKYNSTINNAGKNTTPKIFRKLMMFMAMASAV
jgi:hypothetical protein